MKRLAAPRAALARRLRILAGLIDPVDSADPALAKAERAAALAEARLRAAIDALPEGVVFLDREGRYVLWNQRYAEIYHRSADLFAPGRKLAETLAIGVARGDYPDAAGREDAWIAERLDLLDNPGRRHEQRLADGRWILIEERRTTDGGVIGLRVDITEMKETAARLSRAVAEAESANRAKSEFLSNMSHEIRTPLNGVLGLAHVLARTALDDQQARLVKVMIDSASHLERLLSDLLDLSRLDAGKLEARREPLNLRRLAEGAVAHIAAKAQDKGLALGVDIGPGADGWVVGDALRLRQVLDNLLGNAVKFTAEGSVVLAVRRCGKAVQFEVRDTGIGFEPGEADRLFQRFVQADGSITRRFGGSGLGLAICRELVGLMGGQISARGAPGQGASFHVSLPMAQAEAEPAAADF